MLLLSAFAYNHQLFNQVKDRPDEYTVLIGCDCDRRINTKFVFNQLLVVIQQSSKLQRWFNWIALESMSLNDFGCSWIRKTKLFSIQLPHSAHAQCSDYTKTLDHYFVFLSSLCASYQHLQSVGWMALLNLFYCNLYSECKILAWLQLW